MASLSKMPPSPTAAQFSSSSITVSVRAATAALLTRLIQVSDADNVDVVNRAMERVFADTKVHFLTPNNASWVLHVPRWYRSIYNAAGFRALLADTSSEGLDVEDNTFAQWFERVWELHPPQPSTIKMYGRDVLTPRFHQAYDVTMYSSGTTFEAKPLPPLLQQAVGTMQAMLVNPTTSQSYLRGALLNWYANGEHYIGPHDDADGRILLHSPVFSLSLGATRKFVFSAKHGTKRKRGGESEATPPNGATAVRGVVERLELELQNGDLVVMGGTTQQTHKHALPKTKKCLARRVCITLRCLNS